MKKLKNWKQFNESNDFIPGNDKDRAEVMKKTDDDWYGNYGEDEDEVQLIHHGNIGGYYDKDGNAQIEFRTSVWGNDDFGMYKDFINDEEGAKQLFDELNKLDKINKSDCKKLGMEPF